jgi:hypothetical protein
LVLAGVFRTTTFFVVFALVPTLVSGVTSTVSADVFSCSTGGWGFKSTVAVGVEAELVAVVLGVAVAIPESFGGVLAADFLAGGVFLAGAGFGVVEFRVFMIDAKQTNNR